MARGSKFHRLIRNVDWERARKKVFDRDGWRCQSCGRAGALEAHHVIPLHAGGAALDPDNLKTLCRSCHIRLHRRKMTPEVDAWRDFIARLC